jgi:hypothetical protein
MTIPRLSALLRAFLILLGVSAAVLTARAPLTFAQTARPADQRVPFAVGETLTYDVSWSSFMTAGQATLAVQERTSSAGGAAYHIVADGRPTALVSQLYTLYYKVETWLDASNLLPRRASTYSEEGRRKRTKSTTFDQRAHKAVYDGGGSRRSFTVPPLTQDPLAALYVLRTLGIRHGTVLSMPVVNDGELHRVTLTAGALEPIDCGLGRVRALRVDVKATDSKGEPVGRDMTIWLTTGARQVPVQIRGDLPFGSFRLLLREAHGV